MSMYVCSMFMSMYVCNMSMSMSMKGKTVIRLNEC